MLFWLQLFISFLLLQEAILNAFQLSRKRQVIGKNLIIIFLLEKF